MNDTTSMVVLCVIFGLIAGIFGYQAVNYKTMNQLDLYKSVCRIEVK